MLTFFVTPVVDEWGTTYVPTVAGYSALVAVMLILLVLVGFLHSKVSDKKGGGRKFSTKQLVFSAMAIALAMVTSYIKLIDMPMGGSVTLLSMFFICLIGNWYGLGAGLMTAVSYGILQLIVDPYILTVPQMFVDYIFAFGALGLSGLFCRSKHGLVKGYLIGVLGRYFFTFLSGMIFFGSYASEYNMSAPLYSLIYNGAYIGLEALITVAVIVLPPVNKALLRIKNLANG